MSTTDALFASAFQHHQAGDLVAAEGLYRAILQGDPAHFDSLQLLGTLLVQAGRHEAALAYLGQAIARQPGFALALHNRGLAWLALGQPAAALADFDQAIASQPDYADAYINRGNALQALKAPAAAVASFDRAIALNPAQADAHFNRANALRELAEHEAALDSYEQAIALQPTRAAFYGNRGIVLLALGRGDAALASFEQAIVHGASDAEAYYNRGLAQLKLGAHAAALGSFDAALQRKPDYAEALLNRGNALAALKDYAAALAACEQLLALKPDDAEAYSNRGLALAGLKQHAAAVASYDQALALKPDYAEACYNRANALLAQKQFAAAIAGYNQAIALRPDCAEFYGNRGIAQFELGEFAAAIASYDLATAYQPDYLNAHWNKGLASLLLGDFAQGWRLYECRWHRESEAAIRRSELTQPLWLGGQSLAGKTLMLHGEQGFGDMLQFCRYAPLLAAQGARVVLEVLRPLQALMQSLPGVAEVVVKGQPLPAHDLQCPLLSLPFACQTRLENIPATTPYLFSDAARRAAWGERLGEPSRPRIGLVWSGNPQHKNDHNRSLALSELLPWLPPEFDYLCLQKDVREADQALLAASGIRHFGEALTDFAETAALCASLDLLISVDTSVVHLAGALGKPAWVLLPQVPDWRWLLERDDSPWYPAMRLYRQMQAGDWSSVLRRVQGDLLHWRSAPTV